jgi:hypothetical protein
LLPLLVEASPLLAAAWILLAIACESAMEGNPWA